MANINRDYLVIADLKSGKITSPNMSFYNTDKNIANLFVKLQITMSTNPSITGFVNKEEASNYNVKLSVVKPKTTMLVELTGIVQDESVMGNGAVYLFDMPQNFTDQVGKYICELEITCMVNGREEVVTCDPFEYSVKESVVTGLNIEIEPNPDVPVLRQLIDEVRYLQQNGGSIVNLSGYQKMEDDSLDTNNKTIVGGINELNNSKVEKVEGKGLSTVDFTREKDNKLSGIADNANNYIHPINHEPSIITQDATHRFVTDVEKEIWNNKSEFSGSYNDLTEKPDIPSIDGLATEVYVENKVASIVNSAPETLDTLNELATALGNDPNFATTVANQIGTKASNDYVNAELAKKVNSEGYVATENNYSTAEKTKLANVEDNANNYVHPENHEPSIIIQDNEHRFVTDTEKETWNNKLSEHQDISHLAVKSQVDESLSQINQSNIKRDKKISSIENINAVQNAKLDTLFNSASGEMELESNSNNIKLDSSKKGTATVNYIRGNTLVNCAKENKELILNDEINVEGTICTINDTVEGGLVDVELEGLSLNNIWDFIKNLEGSGHSLGSKNEILFTNTVAYAKCGKVFKLSPNTAYTIFMSCDNKSSIDTYMYYRFSDNINSSVTTYHRFAPNTNTRIQKVITTDNTGLLCITLERDVAPTTEEVSKYTDILLLEGDYTNKPIPTESFTGIKSVGEEVTLTNLVTRYNYSAVQYVATSYVDNSKLKANDICTVVVDNPSEEDMRVYLNEDLFDKAPSFIVPSKSSIKYLATVKKDYVYSADAPQQSALLKNSITHNNSINYKACLVVGDYENSNLEYFEGSIKKYKIETKSQNKNLFKITKEYNNYIESGITVNTNQDILTLTGTVSTNVDVHLNDFNEFISLNKGKYILSKSAEGGNVTGNLSFALKTKEGATIWRGGVSNEFYTIDNSEGEYTKISHIRIHLKQGEVYENTNIRVQLEKSDSKTLYIKNKQHKKVILLDEPLRGIEGGVKDKIIQREVKLYVERNLKSAILSHSLYVRDYEKDNDKTKAFFIEANLTDVINNTSSAIISDKFNTMTKGTLSDLGTLSEGICIDDQASRGYIFIRINKDKLETQDVAGFTKWLQDNPVTIVYQLATPVYEEIKGLDNEFPTYAEITHISTNTVIPCNQKIQNTGIECMLKPSTLYSIHDIRTGSGIAKYNLGGTVNTSNKITTGATLIDNYLRLYGKGFTSKDVEVFEGDTPQTPYFSGMLSAFEDKKITQEMVDIGLEKVENLGKYKVGVKVVGKNLFDGKMELGNIDVSNGNDVSSSTVMRSSFIKVKPPFVFSRNSIQGYIGFRYYDKNKNYIGSLSFNGLSYTITNENVAYFRFTSVNGVISNDYQIEEGTVATPYEPYKEYKTSILLGSPPTKFDEICVQDGQLGVLHNGGEVVYDGNEDWKLYNKVGNQTSVFYLNFPSNGIAKPVLCDLFSFYQQAWDKTHNREGITFDVGANRCYVQIYNIKLETEDEAGFKKWLQKNHCKVVYELAEPYFEPITPQLPRWVLDIFDNSTISIDTIIPVESKFTYTSYIPSITAMQETNKNQDDLINVSLCATDEMYMMLEPLLQSVPQTLQINERMVSKMVDLYIAMVIRGLKTIDEVPLRYREEVKKILEQLEK